MVSISTLGSVHFWMYFWIINHSVTELIQLIDIVTDQVFLKKKIALGRLGLTSKPFLIYQTTAINQKPITSL